MPRKATTTAPEFTSDLEKALYEMKQAEAAFIRMPTKAAYDVLYNATLAYAAAFAAQFRAS